MKIFAAKPLFSFLLVTSVMGSVFWGCYDDTEQQNWCWELRGQECPSRKEMDKFLEERRDSCVLVSVDSEATEAKPLPDKDAIKCCYDVSCELVDGYGR